MARPVRTGRINPGYNGGTQWLYLKEDIPTHGPGNAVRMTRWLNQTSASALNAASQK